MNFMYDSKSTHRLRNERLSGAPTSGRLDLPITIEVETRNTL